METCPCIDKTAFFFQTLDQGFAYPKLLDHLEGGVIVYILQIICSPNLIACIAPSSRQGLVL